MRVNMLPIILIISTILTLNLANPTGQLSETSLYDLKSDVRDFFRFTPTYDLVQLYRSFSNEKYVVNALAYLNSDDIKKLISVLSNLEELRDVVDFMEAENIPLNQVLNETALRLGSEWWQTNSNALETNFKMHDFLEDASKLVNQSKVGNAFINKYLASSVFHTLFSKIQKVDTAKLQISAVKQPIVQRVAIKLALLKVDMKELLSFIALQFLGNNLG